MPLQAISVFLFLAVLAVLAVDSSESIVYELYTRQNPTRPQILQAGDSEALWESSFTPKLSTLIYIPDRSQDGLLSSNHFISRDAFLQQADCNFISVDWMSPLMALESADYASVVRDKVPSAGQHTADFIDFLIEESGASISSFHLIGHGLGAHVAGMTGKSITFGKLPRITGLDPPSTGPEFLFLNDTDSRLSASDADFVVIIHTDSNHFGIEEPIGHLDFYPNGGMDQPGCGGLDSCDHSRAAAYFAESVYTSIGFRAVWCRSWDEFQAGLCDENEAVWMGEYAPFRARGTFYLSTNAEWPFSKG